MKCFLLSKTVGIAVQAREGEQLASGKKDKKARRASKDGGSPPHVVGGGDVVPSVDGGVDTRPDVAPPDAGPGLQPVVTVTTSLTTTTIFQMDWTKLDSAIFDKENPFKAIFMDPPMQIVPVEKAWWEAKVVDGRAFKNLVADIYAKQGTESKYAWIVFASDAQVGCCNY